ncbi:hypothetical protein CONLIGDRAFT_179928 [Coniochaeta ligniaria NRRL 30616]|uniref:Uncharacterized protein n=1 Tax=Coniochaeta ligniaria NRRL 30616 TaxID=1408157 RepID=A0A1J7J143_9PEZI|nr:hypothetical protein CONLIGDRAFT_179928 [Coniochaeta ligniaria NRRL 30616]
MSLPTKYRCPRYGCACARPPEACISFHELNSMLYKAAKTMFPTEDYHYDHVSVLITYWPVGDYKNTVLPDVERLQTVFERSYGFDVQKFEIPHTLASPQAALASRVMNFVREVDDRRRHLKIVYYAGHMDVDGMPHFGRYTESVWTIDWSHIRRNLKSAWMCDILLLLDCYVPCWKLEKVHKGRENVMEVISRAMTPQFSFTKALAQAFQTLHKLFLSGQLPVFTTGVLYNSLLDWCQNWKGSDAVTCWDVPIHQELKQDPHDPRAIQLQPLCNHDDYDWDHHLCSLSQSESNLASPRVPRWLLCKSPMFRLEVALSDYALVVDDLVHTINPWGYWLRHFPVLNCCIKVDEEQIMKFSNGLANSKDYTVVWIPAALAIYLSLELIPAISRWGFKVFGATTPQRSLHEGCPPEYGYDAEWRREGEGVSTGREHGARNSEVLQAQLLDVKRHYVSVLGSLYDMLRTANSSISASWDLQGLDERSRSAELLALFEQVGTEVNKIDEKVDLRDMQQINIACTAHNIFQNVKDRHFPPAVDRTWCVDIFADRDEPTVEHVEDRDIAGSDVSWETDSDLPQGYHSDLAEDLDDPWQRYWISGSSAGDVGTWELVSDGPPAQPESETWW